MRVYQESDDLPASGSLRSTSPDVLGRFIGAGLVAIGAWTIVQEWLHRGDMPWLTVIGFGLAISLVGVAFIARTSARMERWGHRHRLLVASIMITLLIMMFGPFLLTGLGPIFGLGLVVNLGFLPVWFMQRRNARRIAAAMRRARLEDGAEEPAREARKRRPPAPLPIILLDEADLPPGGYLSTRITGESNIAGLPPIRTLLLYNFFSKAQSHKPLPPHGWRLHGPVYQLASPIELARAAGFDRTQDEGVGSRLLSTPEQIEHFLSRQDETPLAPEPELGSWWRRRWERWKAKRRAAVGLPPERRLPLAFKATGAYPQVVLNCTDGSWKHGVAALCARCDLVVLDAAEFSAERLGLAWEVQYLIDTVPLHRLVVLVDGFTELSALIHLFRQAWHACAENSPNQSAETPELLVVAWQGDDSGAWDDANSAPGGRSEDIRDQHRLQLHHRILGLLRGDAGDAAMSPDGELTSSEAQTA